MPGQGCYDSKHWRNNFLSDLLTRKKEEGCLCWWSGSRHREPPCVGSATREEVTDAWVMRNPTTWAHDGLGYIWYLETTMVFVPPMRLHPTFHEQPGKPSHWEDRKHWYDLPYPPPSLFPHCISWLCFGRDGPKRTFHKGHWTSPGHWTFSRTHRDSDYPGHSFPTTVHEVLLWTVFVPSKFMLKS